MTIAVSWIRTVGRTEELVVCTDSRLTGYGKWDCAPKLIPLSRGDCAIAFAGSTLYAYPILLQAMAVMKQHPRVQSRAIDLLELKGHLLRVLNSMIAQLTELPEKEDPPVQFLFSGWSWRKASFVSWVLHFDPHIARFTHRPIRGWTGGSHKKYLSFIGDYFEDFKEILIEKLRQSGKIANGGFDMEPFEALRDILREEKYHSIGGAPQLVKVYRHANAIPHAIYWPDRASGNISLLGRPLLSYESSQFLLLDPDSLEVQKHAL
jgi:hypothetical protein